MEISELEDVAGDLVNTLFDLYHMRLKYRPFQQIKDNFINEVLIISPRLGLEGRVFLIGAVERRIEQLIDTSFNGYEADLKHKAATHLEFLRISCVDERPGNLKGVHLYDMPKAFNYIKKN